MAMRMPFPATVLRPPAPDAQCTCSHSVDCDCDCHDRHCDPSRAVCHVDFLPDDGGLARWGCPRCTPGVEAPHYLGCELIGWNVPMRPGRWVPGSHAPGSGLHATGGMF
jgi:hypothetical protein